MNATLTPRYLKISSLVSRILAPLIALAILLPMAFSPGYQEVDEINHFLIAREALHTWSSRLDIWGRPGCTLFFAPVTPLGLTAARLLAAALTLAVCWGIVQLARALLPAPNPRSWFDQHRDFFLFLLPFTIPPFLLFSASVMTEMPLAFTWIWAAVALAHRRTLLASLLVGLSGLARPEGFFAIAAWPLFLLLLSWAGQKIKPRQLIRATLIAGLPVLLWYLAGTAYYRTAKWPLENWPWQLHGQYGASYKGFREALTLFGGRIWRAIDFGVFILLAQWLTRWPSPRPSNLATATAPPPPLVTTRTILFLLLPPAGLILLHGILGTYNLFGSLPMPRYFISIVPFLVIVVVYGLSQLARLLTGPVVALAALVVMSNLILQPFRDGDLPLRRRLDAIYIDAAVKALPSILPKDQWAQRVVAFHPYVRYRLNIPIQADVYSRSRDNKYLAGAPLGTVVFSDDDLCLREGLAQAPEFYAWGYVLDPKLQNTIAAAYSYPAYLHIYVWIKKIQPDTAPATK